MQRRREQVVLVIRVYLRAIVTEKQLMSISRVGVAIANEESKERKNDERRVCPLWRSGCKCSEGGAGVTSWRVSVGSRREQTQESGRRKGRLGVLVDIVVVVIV